MKITKNIRISLYILIPILFWMLSGVFKTQKIDEPELSNDLFTVQTVISNAVEYQPNQFLNACKTLGIATNV